MKMSYTFGCAHCSRAFYLGTTNLAIASLGYTMAVLQNCAWFSLVAICEPPAAQLYRLMPMLLRLEYRFV